MISIAICDDDRALTGSLESMLREDAALYGLTASCDVFFDGASLVEAVRDRAACYELALLDIEMHGMDGIRAAQALRDMDLPILIVYISCHEEYLMDLFATEPFRFLHKPVNREELCRVFLDACRRIRRKAGYFTFSCQRTFHKIPYDRILYFESRGRTILIHTSGRETTETPVLRFYGKMNDIDNLILESGARFLRIHQSFLVNFDHVRSLSFTDVELEGGLLLQISGDRRRAVRERYCALVSEEGGCHG